MPIVLPSPAAPITSPISSVVRCSQPGSGCWRSRKAMYIVRKPDSIRSPALQRSAKITSAGTRNFSFSPVRLTGSSPAWASALAGSRIERMVAPAKTTNAKRSDHWAPKVAAAPASGAADRRADHARERDPAVGLDQGQARRLQAGDGRGPGHAVRLGGDEYAEGRREHRERLRGHRVGHQPAQERAQGHRAADRPAAAVAEPVEERAEQGGDDRERQHRQPEEQRDLPARLAGLGEEQGAGQGDRHGSVAGGVERVQLDQPVEAGVAGALGVRGPPRLPEGVRRSRAGRRAGCA